MANHAPVYNALRDLLYDNACVIVPDFGGFLLRSRPAEFKPHTSAYHPPASTLAFNKNLKDDDGLLTNAIAKRENISYEEAQDEIASFVSASERSLGETGSVIVPEIGKLYLDADRILKFRPSENGNYRLESYGLPVLNVVPVERKAKVVQMTDVAKEKGKVPFWAAAAGIALLFSAGLMFFGNGNANSTLMSSLNPSLNNTETNRTSETDISETVATYPAVLSREKAATVSETIAAQNKLYNETEARPYHVVVGMFKTMANARKMKHISEVKGYETTIVSGNKYKRVIIAFDARKNGQLTTLRKIKREVEPDAWIWENRHKTMN